MKKEQQHHQECINGISKQMKGILNPPTKQFIYTWMISIRFAMKSLPPSWISLARRMGQC